jgi:hypothetical protein
MAEPGNTEQVPPRERAIEPGEPRLGVFFPGAGKEPEPLHRGKEKRERPFL